MIVRMMNSAAGEQRPETVLFGDNRVQGEGVYVKALTASATLLATEYGKAFSNLGAGGAVVATLPAPVAGVTLLFFKLTAQNLTLTAAAGTTVNGAASFANTAAETTALCWLVGISATEWIVLAVRGTWS